MSKSRSKQRLPAHPAPRGGTEIVACGRRVDIGTPVVLWSQRGGLTCPNPRGRAGCRQHDPALNDFPTRPQSHYKIHDAEHALDELRRAVHQFILHYDVCFTSHHCHQVLADSDFKGSHFYLDLDGTIYQTCDLYWKTNTAPADDRRGNERAVHVEMANLSWQALASESDLHRLKQDAYRQTAQGWRLSLPARWRDTLRTPGFRPAPARAHAAHGYFSRTINGRRVRMWDFTEEQYRALVRLCLGVNQLLPRIALAVPQDPATGRTPLGRIDDFARFQGILGHAHVQGGTGDVKRKYDPGSAFHWGRLRRELARPGALPEAVAEPLHPQQKNTGKRSRPRSGADGRGTKRG